jgi:hypothetical protein
VFLLLKKALFEILKQNYVLLKKYGERYKIIFIRGATREKGWQDCIEAISNNIKGVEKMSCSLVRSKSRIYELAVCNDWDYFVTLTLDKEKIDRYDLGGYIKKFGYFIQHYNSRSGGNVKYILIPEMHKDGAWHMHGFMKGINNGDLQGSGNYDKKTMEQYKTWRQYAEKFGFMSLARIQNKEACSVYVTKYVTKGVKGRKGDLNKKMYYCSKGLKRAEIISEGEVIDTDLNGFVMNEYGGYKWLRGIEEINDNENQIVWENKDL